MSLINTKDVITMLMPYPNISSDLAVKPHMYICWHSNTPNYKFVKCQSLKPSMIGDPKFVHYVDEPADITRNPFKRTSRIDCDKSFATISVTYDDRLRTTLRPDVCEDLFTSILEKLYCDGYSEPAIDEAELITLNRYIQPV